MMPLENVTGNLVWTRLWCERKNAIRDECSAKSQLVLNWNSGVDTFARGNWQINKKDKEGSSDFFRIHVDRLLDKLFTTAPVP